MGNLIPAKETTNMETNTETVNMTVCEAAERAYGLPKGASGLYAGWREESLTSLVAGLALTARVEDKDPFGHDVLWFWSELEEWAEAHSYASGPLVTWGPDISDRPAAAFVGFFGEGFDEVVKNA